LKIIEKAKPVVRRGRKATDLMKDSRVAMKIKKAKLSWKPGGLAFLF
jgi:hypothetical protein